MCLKEPWQHLAAASVGEGLCRGVRRGFLVWRREGEASIPLENKTLLFLGEGEAVLGQTQEGS